MAIDMFLKIEGVEGESTDKSHQGEIDILSWSWGMSQSGTTHMGGGGGSGKVSVQDLSLTKYIDKSSTVLLTHCATGKHIPKAVLTVRNGFAVTGRPSVSVSPENDNAELGVCAAKLPRSAAVQPQPLWRQKLSSRRHASTGVLSVIAI